MGENKGHGIKGPRHDDDVEDLSINSADSGLQQQGSLQSGAQQGNRQSVPDQQQGNQRKGGQQPGSQQSGKQQQGSQQQGGQHASGGTPALDDLGSRQGESARDASQAWNTDNSIDKQRGNR